MLLTYAAPVTVLAENVALLAKRAGGQESLASVVGVSQGTISRWAKGTAPRTIEKLEPLARYAGVPVNDLVTILLKDGAPSRTRRAPPLLLLPVQLPSEERLTAMMESLLASVGLGEYADEHAETLARRLPNALAQAAADLLSPEMADARDSDAPRPDRAAPHP